MVNRNETIGVELMIVQGADYYISLWSGAFADPGVERLYWHDTWSNWSKVARYAAIFLGVALLGVMALQFDIPALASNENLWAVLSARAGAIILFAAVVILSFSATPRPAVLQAAVAAAMAGVTLATHTSLAIFQRDFSEVVINHLGVLVFIYLICPNRAGYRLFNGAVAFIAFVAASISLNSALSDSIIAPILLGVGTNILGFVMGGWRDRKRRADYRQRIIAEQEHASAIESLRASEAEMRTMLDNLVDTFYRTDAEGRITMISPSITALSEFLPDELIGRHMADRYADPNDREEFLRQLSAGGGRINGYEARLRAKSGKEIWVSTSARYFHDKDGNITGVEGIVRDITDRRRAEDKLRASQQHYRDLVELNPDAVLVQVDGRIVLANTGACRMFGAKCPDQLVGRASLDIVAPQHQAAVREHRMQAMSHGSSPIQCEAEHQRLNGAVFPTELSLSPINWDGQRGTINIVKDISARKLAEQEILQNERRFRDFAEASSDWLWETDAAHRYTYVSQRLVEHTGMPLEHWLNSTRFDTLAAAQERDVVEAHIRDIQAHRPFRNLEYWIERPNGLQRFRTNGIPKFDEGGSFLGYRGTGSDISAEAIARQEAEQATQLLLDAIETFPGAIAFFDAGDKLVYMNAHYRDLAGGAAVEELKGQNFEAITRQRLAAGVLPDAAEKAAEWLDARLTYHRDPEGVFRVRFGAEEGRSYDIHEQRTPNGGTLSIYLDVSEAVERENQLRRAQRLQAMGTLVGGLAHEMNNLLQPIGGLSELALDQLDKPEIIEQALQGIRNSNAKANEILQGMLSFARKEERSCEPVDLASTLADSLRIIRPLLPHGVNLSLDVKPNAGQAVISPAEFTQIVMNLVKNATDAMEENGEVRISLMREETGAAMAHLSIGDQGPGISPEVADNIFEPFFTTKGVGEGTGLGLSVVHNIVKDWGGSIHLANPTGGGARFDIDIPLV